MNIFLRVPFYFSMIKPAERLFSNLTNWLFKSSVQIGRNPKIAKKTVRNVAKTTFFSFIFPIPLSYTSWPSFSIVICSNQKLEQKTCNTRATLLWSHLRCDTWDVRKFVFHPKKSRQFFPWKSAFFLYWIPVSNLLYFVIGVIVKMLFNVVCCRPRHVESPCGNLGLV